MSNPGTNTNNKVKPDVFLNYAPDDEQIAGALYQKLVESGLKPWMESQDLIPGSVRQAIITKAITESALVLVCLTPRYTQQRGDFQKELKTALEQAGKMLPEDIFIIPVRLENCDIPAPLQPFHVIDLFRDESNFEWLVQAIKTGLAQREHSHIHPTDEPIRARVSPGSEVQVVTPHLTKKQPFPAWVRKKPARIALGGLALLLALGGIPWVYDHYIDKLPRPAIPETCTVNLIPVQVGIAPLAGCSDSIEEQLFARWDTNIADTIAISGDFDPNTAGQATDGMDVLVWGECDSQAGDTASITFKLVTSRKPFTAFEPDLFTITASPDAIGIAGEALINYQYGDYEKSESLFSSLPAAKMPAEIAFLRANSLLFDQKYSNAETAFENFTRQYETYLSGAYNNLGIALHSSEMPSDDSPYSFKGQEELGKAIELARQEGNTGIEILALTNRSLVYLEGESWISARNDCNTALNLDARAALPQMCLAIYNFAYYIQPERMGILPFNEIDMHLSAAEAAQETPPYVHFVRAEWYLEKGRQAQNDALDAYVRYLTAMEHRACLSIDRAAIDAAKWRIEEMTR